MTTCEAPEDIIAVFLELLPVAPFASLILFGIAVVLMSVEGVLTFRFGGVPDGLIGAIGAVFGGIGVIVWAGNWPESCGGTISLLGWVLIGVSVLIALVLFLFWRARRHDGGFMMRGYGDQNGGGFGGY